MAKLLVEVGDVRMGDRVRDPITGIEGIVICVAQWRTGCARVSIGLKADKDGKVPDHHCTDITGLEIIERGAFPCDAEYVEDDDEQVCVWIKNVDHTVSVGCGGSGPSGILSVTDRCPFCGKPMRLLGTPDKPAKGGPQNDQKSPY